jgi:hypothetical protein
MLTVAPSPASRLIWTPGMRCSESAMVTSGSLPMSSDEIASTIEASRRLTSTERICEPRMPVTTTSSTCEDVVRRGLGVSARGQGHGRGARQQRQGHAPGPCGLISWIGQGLRSPNVFMAVLDPAGFDAGCMFISPVDRGPGLPGEPRFKRKSRWRPLRPSTHTLAHALPSRVSRSTNVPFVSIKMSTLSFCDASARKPLHRREPLATRPDPIMLFYLILLLYLLILTADRDRNLVETEPGRTLSKMRVLNESFPCGTRQIRTIEMSFLSKMSRCMSISWTN